MRCTKTISPPGMASYRKSSPHRSMMEMCCSCFMDTKYKCLRCSHKMAFTSKSTPTSPNLQRTTYHFVQKRKILKRSACESKTIKRFYTCFHTGRESVWPVSPCVVLSRYPERLFKPFLAVSGPYVGKPTNIALEAAAGPTLILCSQSCM